MRRPPPDPGSASGRHVRIGGATGGPEQSRRFASVPASSSPSTTEVPTPASAASALLVRASPSAATSSTRFRAGVMRSGAARPDAPRLRLFRPERLRHPHHHAQHHAARAERVVGDPIDEAAHLAGDAAIELVGDRGAACADRMSSPGPSQTTPSTSRGPSGTTPRRPAPAPAPRQRRRYRADRWRPG
jgi:hypothetical protein